MTDRTNLYKGINRIFDSSELTDLEKQHEITINVADNVTAGIAFEVELIVGEKLTHPNNIDHWIQYIELLIGEARVNQFEMDAATITTPSVKFKITLPKWASSELTARLRCNQHGIWESKKLITID